MILLWSKNRVKLGFCSTLQQHAIGCCRAVGAFRRVHSQETFWQGIGEDTGKSGFGWDVVATSL